MIQWRCERCGVTWLSDESCYSCPECNSFDVQRVKRKKPAGFVPFVTGGGV